MAAPGPRGSTQVARYTRRRARRADRREPRLHQLDRPDRAGGGLVRGRRPGPAAHRRHARLPRLHRRSARCSWRLLAIASDGALPAGAQGGPVAVDPAWDVPRRAALWVFAGLAAAVRGRHRPGPPGARARARRAWPPAGAVLAARGPVVGRLAPSAPSLLFVQLAVLSAATGGVWAAMILGHWYLVTPKLAEAPLVLFARLLMGVVGAAARALRRLGRHSAAGRRASPGMGALTGTWALFVWLRLIVGIVFPLVVSWAAVQTARTRSMESATGLLYINVGTIAAGTILAAGLYFGAGLLV